MTGLLTIGAFLSLVVIAGIVHANRKTRPWIGPLLLGGYVAACALYFVVAMIRGDVLATGTNPEEISGCGYERAC